MSYRNPHSRAGLSGSVTVFMLLVMIAAAASGSLGPRERASALPTMRPASSQKLNWTAGEIHSLIVTIEESERNGFDSRRYGLAALKSELEQTTELWGRPGTRQLDTLANSSAVALANDYRDRAGLAPVTTRELDAVLKEGNLHAWLMASSVGA